VTTEEILQELSDMDPEMLLADGFEEAIRGTAYRCAFGPVVAYDRGKCIRILMDRDGMAWEEAEEFFSFNVEGAYVGERSPVYVTDFRAL